MRMHAGTMFAGIVYLAVGLSFVAEALGWWDLQVADLRYAGPIALVLAGFAVVVGSIRGSQAN